MELAKNIILLLVGVAVFLLGMNMMSGGLKKATGPKIKNLFDKFKTNRFAGIGVGAATTALIQSSAATSVMAIGFINAGIMSIFQALSIIMGAYIGTNITGLLVSLSSFNNGGTSVDITIFFMVFAFIGVVMTFFNNQKIKHIGEIFAGLGLLFFGLFTLKDALASEQINEFSRNVFSAISNPFLLLIVGALFTMLLQSSSASTGIMIVMCSTGAVGVSSAVYVALGATIGTVLTTIIATIGGSTNAKRVGVICFLMKVVAGLVSLSILWPLDSAFGIFETMSNWFATPGLFIAVFMVIYNAVVVFVMLPFMKGFEKLSIKLIEDKKSSELESYVKFIDKNMLKNPDIALMQVKKEIVHMNELAFENYKRGFFAITNVDLTAQKEIEKCEDGIDYLNKAITDFLIELSAKSGDENQKIIGGYFHAINDIERIGDHASNFLDQTIKMSSLGLKFSSVATRELNEFNETLEKMFVLSFQILDKGDVNLLSELHKLEDKTDTMKESISTAHFDRITKGECVVELSPFLSTLVSELERIADHLTNIGYIQLNPTGDED